MKDARFTIPTPALLAKVVDLIDKIPMDQRDTKGDLYEYMLGKIASAGQNGQFRTPRHIINLMVALTDPQPTDVICDPAAGTCGYLVAAGEYLREHHKGLFRDKKLKEHFNHGLFHGYDFDNTMLRTVQNAFQTASTCDLRSPVSMLRVFLEWVERLVGSDRRRHRDARRRFIGKQKSRPVVSRTWAAAFGGGGGN